MDLNINQLKKELEIIYNNYLINPDDENVKNKAGNLYNKYKDLDPFLKSEIAAAIRNLVDIAFDTGIKISREDVIKILDDLKNDIS